MIESYTFTSEVNWPKLLIFWAVHWNEPCGTLAIQKIIQLFENKKIILQKWSVTYVPVANPVAFEANQRYKEKNLNRIFWKYSSPSCDEEVYSNYLAGLIDSHDYLLDIHSTSEDTLPYVFQDFNDNESKQIAQSISSSYVVSWWQDLYQESLTWDTISYAYKMWKKGVLIECWQHVDPSSIQVAYDAIISFLLYFWVIEHVWNKSIQTWKYIVMKQVIYKDRDWILTSNWKNFDYVEKWTVIARYNDWESILAQDNGYVIMPDTNADIWEEWFYFWVASISI